MRLRYHRNSRATTLLEALELEATTKDIQLDYRRGFIKFPSHESDLPGHIYSAVEVLKGTVVMLQCTIEQYGYFTSISLIESFHERITDIRDREK